MLLEILPVHFFLSGHYATSSVSKYFNNPKELVSFFTNPYLSNIFSSP